MSDYCCLALAPLYGLALDVIVQSVLFRLLRKKKLLFTLLLGFLFGLALTVWLTIVECRALQLGKADMAGFGLLGVLFFITLNGNYLVVININITALRIRVLQELRAAGGHLSIDVLQKMYDTDAMIDYRLRRLVANRQLTLEQGKYMKGRGSFFLRLASCYDVYRLIVFGSAQASSAMAAASRQVSRPFDRQTTHLLQMYGTF